tara:strand:+ start:11199 stop:12194 length:996 start_codon:yes stop_codon:yes gene_type:complete
MESNNPIGEPQEAFQEPMETSQGQSDSVFDDLFQGEAEATFAEENTENVNSEVQAGYSEEVNDKNTDSYTYWQSEADKRANERDDLYNALGVRSVEEAREMANQYKDVMPIAKYVKNNKQVLDVVEASLRGEPIGNQQEVENQPTQVQKPVKPVQPQGYDALDSIQDPESTSYKYRQELETYRDDIIDYTQMENETLRNNIQMSQQEQQRVGEVNQLKDQLRNQYGYNPQQADDFVSWAAQDQSFSMENLIDLHGRIRGINNLPAPTQPSQPFVEPQVERKMQEMIAQRQRLSQPGTVATAGSGDTMSQRPVEDRVMEELVSSDRKANPWT